MSADSADRDHIPAAWFLARGVPAVLTRRDRWRDVLSRSAPGLAAYLTGMLVYFAIAVLTGGQDITIDGDPTLREWTVLVLLTAVLPALVLAGWAVSRLRDRRVRRAVGLAAIVLAPLSDLYQDGPWDAVADLVTDVVVLCAILLCTASGLESILAWGVRTTLNHLAAAGRLAARALPVVLLTVLVFFNSPVWSMAANLSTDRFWLLAAFMAVIAISFLTASMRDRVRAVTADVEIDGHSAPLRRGERVNLMFVAVGSQVIQIVSVALVTVVIFFVLGFIVLSPAVLSHWTGGNTDQVEMLGVGLPIPLPLAHVTLFQGGLTLMYLSARAVSDPEHRTEFLDPLFKDLTRTLDARDAYVEKRRREGRTDGRRIR